MEEIFDIELIDHLELEEAYAREREMPTSIIVSSNQTTISHLRRFYPALTKAKVLTIEEVISDPRRVRDRTVYTIMSLPVAILATCKEVCMVEFNNTLPRSVDRVYAEEDLGHIPHHLAHYVVREEW